MHEPARKAGRNPYLIPPYKREAGGSNPPAPTRKGQVRPHVDLDKTLSPESQREPPVHARGCGNGAPRAGSIIVDHEGAPCTDSRYHRHCRVLDRGEPDGWRAPRAGPSDRLGAGRGPGRQSSIGCRAARTDRGETRSRLVGLGSRAVDTFRNSRCVEPAACRGPRIDHSSTRDSPPVSPSMVPEALSNSERVRLEKAPPPVGEGAGWLKMSQVNRSDGVLAPHRDLSINQTPDANFGGWDVTAPPLGVARARRP